MDDHSPRLGLPFLQAGQAQKEVLHNEALTAVDLLIGAIAETIGDNAPPSAPAIGQCWIVGDTPLGAWAGQAGAVAGWTAGGWRFVAPPEGLGVRVRSLGATVRRSGGGWSAGEVDATALRIGGVQVVGARRPAIAAPSGGATVDAQARATLATVLSMLQSHGLISS